ncbi:MAG: hypothetical protein ABFR47_07375 [Verrucomicrobiota bacterium]
MKTTTPQKKKPTMKQRERRNRERAGTTIVETLVALVLFATFIAGAVRVVMAQRQVSDKARMHYTAINIAKNRIEQVRNMRHLDYEQIKNMDEPAPGVPVNQDGDPVGANEGKFRRITTITPAAHNNYRLEIRVEVKIRNPITLNFGEENEHVKSYMAKLL